MACFGRLQKFKAKQQPRVQVKRRKILGLKSAVKK